ncbi:COG4705 family protein [Pseudomonas japonica]|uniref:COG4705 family protein n=1 Tax=Pseudomonas japonica TaxID=256466 RepID=UPI0015E3364D|nr:hypothetical protein [Pseudomonas japonica]MBA1241834.1 hypothetical protein [Pseudomonas japonica]MBA1288905.1 hypothetical protein [Pseudomonas japonica]
MTNLPKITLAFWITKICATTLGETAGDLLSTTLDVGYALSSLILFTAFLVALMAQLSTRKHYPLLFWMVVLATSIMGATLSDLMDRTLDMGYACGSVFLMAILWFVFALWYFTEGTVSIRSVRSRRSQLFLWCAILVSNTLGTALGDFLAEDSGLGFAGSAAVIGSTLLLITILRYGSRLSAVLLFWLAFVLTRPLGATVGDYLTKGAEQGGLGFGTACSSAMLLTILIAFVGIAALVIRNRREIGTPKGAAWMCK